MMSQPEVHELKEHLMASLRELQRLAPVAVQETTLPAPTRVARSAAQRRHRTPEIQV